MLLALSPSGSALAQPPRPTAPKLLVCLHHFYAIKLSTPQEYFLEILDPLMGLWLQRNILLTNFFVLKSVRLNANMGV